MKDRVSEYPGRTKMTRADGSVEYVTLTRADEPQIEGDALCKANLLPDSLASTLKLPQSNPQVKDALSAIHEGAKAKVVSYAGTGAATRTIQLGTQQPKLMCIYCEGATIAPGYGSSVYEICFNCDTFIFLTLHCSKYRVYCPGGAVTTQLDIYQETNGSWVAKLTADTKFSGFVAAETIFNSSDKSYHMYAFS